MESVLINDLEESFLAIVSRHNNGRWATNELEHSVFINNKYNFYSLDEDLQWSIRGYLKSLRFIYGEKQFGDL